MKIDEKEDGFWIVDTPEGVGEMGPYAWGKDAEHRYKKEALEEARADLAGVRRFLKDCEK